MEVLKFYKALFDAALMSIEENFNQIDLLEKNFPKFSWIFMRKIFLGTKNKWRNVDLCLKIKASSRIFFIAYLKKWIQWDYKKKHSKQHEDNKKN